VHEAPPQVFILESPPVAALMEAFGDMKFGLIACLLWLTGRRALAGKVHDAWKVSCNEAFVQRASARDCVLLPDIGTALTCRLVPTQPAKPDSIAAKLA